MITEKEYLDALKIVETYRVEQFLKTTKVGDITCKEFYYKYKDKMSTKLKNAFKNHVLDYIHYIDDLSPKDFIKFRHVGEKTQFEYATLYCNHQAIHERNMSEMVDKFVQ
jgi:hypothetical protein